MDRPWPLLAWSSLSGLSLRLSTQLFKPRKAFFGRFAIDTLCNFDPSLFRGHGPRHFTHSFFHFFLLVIGPRVSGCLRLCFRYLGGRRCSSFLLHLLLRLFLDLLKMVLLVNFLLLFLFCSFHILLLNLLGLLNDLFLNLCPDKFSNYFPSIVCTRRKFRDTFGQKRNFIYAPIILAQAFLGLFLLFLKFLLLEFVLSVNF